MTFRAAAKGRKLLLLAAVCLLPALLLSPTAEASRSLPASAVDLTPPVRSWDAEAPPTPQLELFHLEDELLVELLTGVEPEHHQALLEHRRLELLSPSSTEATNQKTASGVSTSDLELNIQKGKHLKPDPQWTVPFYAKARFYDPEVGRFLNEDPAEPDLTTPPSLHKYLYAYGNPTVYWDPDGRQAISEMQAHQAAEEASRAYPEVRDKRLDEYDLIEQKAIEALAASGITDPLGQRAFLVEYARDELRMKFEAASALTNLVLGPIQPWEFEGKDWTRQMTEVKLEWAKQSEFIHTWGYIYINLWLMSVGAGEGAMEMPITTQQKLAFDTARVEMAGGSVEGLGPLASRNTPGGPGRSGGTIFEGSSFENIPISKPSGPGSAPFAPGEPLVAESQTDWMIAKHGDMPSPRPSGYQSHHGVNSVWAEANVGGYVAKEAPAVLMRNNPYHNATRGVFNRVRAEIARRQGVSSRNVDWTEVAPGTAWRIAEEQLEAARVPQSAQDQYFRAFNAYLETLK